MLKYFAVCAFMIFFVLFLFSCSSANNKPIRIHFSPDSSSIVFAGVDQAGLNQLRYSPGIDTSYQDILAVYQTVSENDSTGKEEVLKGRIEFSDSTVVFRPAVPFVKGKQYMAISFMNIQFGGGAKLVKGKLNAGLKPSQVFLSR
jgi:hypothetical protein